MMAKIDEPRSHIGRTIATSINTPIAATIGTASTAARKIGSPRRASNVWQTMPPSMTKTPCAKLTIPLAL